MLSLNKVMLIGNLTKDPELRYTPSGTAVTNLRVAVNRKFKDRNGELKEDTCFVTVAAWDKQAEACSEQLKKGNPVFVEGILQSRSWDTPDGQKRSIIDVRAERIQFFNTAFGKTAGAGVKTEGPVTGDSQPIRPDDVVWEE